jgi:cathepsin A (carboxypeptidase C)
MHRRRGLALAIGIIAVGALSVSTVAASTTSQSDNVAGKSADRVTSLPGLGKVATPQYAGYASVTDDECSNLRCTGTDDAGLFYWFVGATDADDTTPTILWTSGGPGSTSFWGFFTENGPYRVDSNGKLHARPQAWNDTANYLIFDHPLGVGLSFADDGLPTNVKEGVDQWYAALVNFLERHPEVADNPIILAGESYGGTYDALLAKAILDGNASAGKEVVKLGGVVIAAGWVDPVVQQSMDTTYALAHGVITPTEKATLDEQFAACQAAVAAETPSSAEANTTCSEIKSSIQEISGLYMLNIAEAGDPPTQPMIDYLNRADVRKAIHAKSSGDYTIFSEAIGDAYVVGEQDSYRSTVQEVLDAGIPVMVISGLNDATDVNFLGTGAWLRLLEGGHAGSFQAAPTVQWKAGKDDAVLGYVQEGDTLSWVRVLNAGHLAVGDQPLLIDLIAETLIPS